LIYDAVRFAQAFNDPIADHPLSVYYSALPFVPIHSTLFQTFHDRNIFSVVVAGFETSWSPLLRIIPGYPEPVVAFSRDGTRVACGSFKKCLDIRVLDLTSGLDVVSPLHGEGNGITSLTFSHDGSRMVSGDRQGIITMWDAVSGRKAFQLHAAHKYGVYLVEFSPDGQRFVSGSSNDGRGFSTPSSTNPDNLLPHFSELQVWDASSGIQLLHLNTAAPLAFSPDGAQFVLVYGINIIDVYETSSGQLLATSLPSGNTNHKFDYNDVIVVVWALDGVHIVIGSNHDGITIWNAASRTKIRSLELAQGLTRWVSHCVWGWQPQLPHLHL
jgi:WD40 repeat protein